MIQTASADDILTELEAIVSLFTASFPDATIARQNIPEKPAPNTFVIAFQNAGTENGPGNTYVNTREWQIIYVSGPHTSDSANVLRALSSAQKVTIGNPRMVIPIDEESRRYMRITGFGISQVAELEGEQKAGLAIMTTQTRQARDTKAYEKILEAGVRTV